MPFVPYPDIHDADFSDKVFWKKEFNRTRYGSDFIHGKTEDMCRRGEFRMQNHQEFVRNFISSETPYNGILLFHGTGVGKTCASIGISEGLRDYVHKNGKKIYVLSSETIRPNFYKELYSADREKTEQKLHSIPGSYQCSGDRYYIHDPKAKLSEDKKIKRINKIIEDYYEFRGQQQFVNYVDISLGAHRPANVTKPLLTNDDGSDIDIGDHFSNSVIIIDEAHGIAGANKRDQKPLKKKPSTKQQEEEVDDADLDFQEEEVVTTGPVSIKTTHATSNRSPLKVLLDIIKRCRAKGNNLKLILLTATPMKDNVRELADLLELLNANDGGNPEIFKDKKWKEKLFPADFMTRTDVHNTFTADKEKTLIKLARGYVSYVKGNNPITFPHALLPDAIQIYEPTHRLVGRVSHPIYPYRADAIHGLDDDIQDVYNKDTPPNYKFNLVKCDMNPYQYLCYYSKRNGLIAEAPTKRKSKGRKVKDSSDQAERMLSNIAFPLNGEPAENYIGNPAKFLTSKQNYKVIGKHGFESCFSQHGSAVKYYRFRSFNFLRGEVLARYSKKLYMFVQNVIASPGLAYAYSEFIPCGALIAAMALEANGYVRYDPDLPKNLKKSGVPKDNIRDNLPQCFLLEQDTRDTIYRCAKCGRLSSDHPEHADGTKFVLSTYILVTGSHSTIDDIKYATTDNLYGHKIKAVVGTRVTGQGVDFRWVRQIHILDPWHNNTRIFQAIGRGLRHCSHADLKPDERNVTIFKYCTTAPVELIDTHNIADADLDQHIKLSSAAGTPAVEMPFTYKDLLRESIDEYMYRRVIRKDIIIKKIERTLKRTAIDCELNKHRNMLPSYDKDYSRECDYDTCVYPCDNFTPPIKYIQTIRRYNNPATKGHEWEYFDGAKWIVTDEIYTESGLAAILDEDYTNEDLWKKYMYSHTMLETADYKDLLVDIPIGAVDNSTYDIYFSEPQVDRAKKIIIRLFQRSSVFGLNKIIFLVTRADPKLERKFIYTALDQLVGHPPHINAVTTIDKFGREGNIIVKGGYYIFHPKGLVDTNIPMRYRVRPLTIKKHSYNTEILKKTGTRAVVSTKAVVTLDHDVLSDAIHRMKIISVHGVIKMYMKIYKTTGKSYLSTDTLSRLLEKHVGNSAATSRKNLDHLLEFLFRMGMCYFNSDNEADMDRPISALMEECYNGQRNLINIMGGASNVKVFNGEIWRTHQIDDDALKSVRLQMSRGYGAGADPLAQVKYPTANRGHKLLNIKLNIKEQIGLYGMVTYTAAREPIQPLTYASKFKAVILKSIESYDSNKELALKLVDQQHVKLKTKGTSKDAVTGRSCMTFNLVDVTKLYNHMYAILETAYTEDNTVFQSTSPFSDIMALFGLPDFRGLAKAKVTKQTICGYMETMLMIADYCAIKLDDDPVKWYLNPLESEFYRPKQSGSRKKGVSKKGSKTASKPKVGKPSKG